MINKGITRREFLGVLAAAGASSGFGFGQTNRIDRYALVSRHNPVLRKFDPMSPLSVGNGEFAFTCDVTGLQTFPELYKDAMPLCTMSQWGWHTTPLPNHLRGGKQLRLTDYDTHGRAVGYMTSSDGQKELFDWLRENPHRLHLGQIGFLLMKSDGSKARSTDLADIEQKLDLWTGAIHSSFNLEGKGVKVATACHPELELLVIQVESELLQNGKLFVRFAFPYGSQTMQATDWGQLNKHKSYLILGTPDPVGSAVI